MTARTPDDENKESDMPGGNEVTIEVDARVPLVRITRAFHEVRANELMFAKVTNVWTRC